MLTETPSPEPRVACEKDDDVSSTPTGGIKAKPLRSQAYTVSVIAYGSLYDVPVTSSTRVMSVLREVAEMTISSSDADALGDVNAALFYQQVPLLPETPLHTLPKDCVLHFHTSIETLVARGRASSFIKVTDLMRNSGAGVPLQPYPRHGDSVAASCPIFSHAPRTVPNSYAAGDADDAMRLRMLQNHLQYQQFTRNRASVSYPFTPTGLDAPQAPASAPVSMNYRAWDQAFGAASRGRFTAAMPGNPWGLEERGPTYRVPIRASQDFLAVAESAAMAENELAIGDSASQHALATPESAEALTPQKKKSRALEPININVNANGPHATAKSTSISPIAAVKKKLKALRPTKRSSPQQAALAASTPTTEEKNTKAAQPMLWETIAQRLSPSPKTRSTTPGGAKRNGYYEASPTPEQKPELVSAEAPAAVAQAGVDKNGADALVEEVRAADSEDASGGDDAQHRMLLFDRRGLGPHAPTLTGGKRKKYLRYLRVLRIAPVSAIRDHYHIDADKQLYIGAAPIDDESATIESTVVFLGDGTSPVRISFAEPILPRTSNLTSDAVAEAALLESQESYHERAQQRASPVPSPVTSPRSLNGAPPGSPRASSPPPLPMPSTAAVAAVPPASPRTAAPENDAGDSRPVEEGGSKPQKTARSQPRGESAKKRGRTAKSPSTAPSAQRNGRKQPQQPRGNVMALTASENGLPSPSAGNASRKGSPKTTRRSSPFGHIKAIGSKVRQSAAQMVRSPRAPPTDAAKAKVPPLADPDSLCQGPEPVETTCPGEPAERELSGGTTPSSGASAAPTMTTATTKKPSSAKPKQPTHASRGDTAGSDADPSQTDLQRPASILQRDSTVKLRAQPDSALQQRFGSNGSASNSERRRSAVSVDSPGNSLIHTIAEYSCLASQNGVGDEGAKGLSVPPPLPSPRSSRSPRSSGSRAEQSAKRIMTSTSDTPVVDESSTSLSGTIRIIVRDPRDHERFHFNIPVEPDSAAFVIREWMTECLEEIAQEKAMEAGSDVSTAAAAAVAAVDDYTDVERYDLYCGHTRIEDPSMTFQEATGGKSDCIFSLYKRDTK